MMQDKISKTLKIIRNIIIDLIIVLLGIIAIIAISSFIQLNVQKKEYTNILGYSLFSTQTGSMSPTIEKGDIVIVKLKNEDIKENDIITYKKDNSFITHRVVSIEGDSIIAKGDNNNTIDEPIKKDAVVGKSVFIINNVEIWKKVFTDINVIIPIVITIILFVILISYKEKTEIDEQKTEKKEIDQKKMDEQKTEKKKIDPKEINEQKADNEKTGEKND